MAFLEEMLTLIGLDKELLPFPFRVTLLGERGIFIEGVKTIESFSVEKVVLKTKSGYLEINGENLKITKYGEGDVALNGKINGVCLRWKGENCL